MKNVERQGNGEESSKHRIKVSTFIAMNNVGKLMCTMVSVSFFAKNFEFKDVILMTKDREVKEIETVLVFNFISELHAVMKTTQEKISLIYTRS